MKTLLRDTLFLGSALALAACGGELNSLESLDAAELGQTEAPLRLAAPGKAIADAYIIQLKEGADPRAVAAIAGVSPRHVYTVLNGFAADLNEGQLTALRRHPAVEAVEQDAVTQAHLTQTNAPWNLDCIDQPASALNGTYTYNTTAPNVNAYIIDTGIATSHAQFGGRATNVFDAFGGTGQDCNGHGTHVAGIVGSTTYGVAKSVKLRGVRVLDCNGSGSNSGVIAGIDYVRTNHVAPAVANISLGGGYSAALNTAVANLSNAGVFVAVAAGSSNSDACTASPASVPGVMTVTALATCTTRAAYANYGPCVDIYAPGSNITSTWSTGGTSTVSGTSMASPHVAAVAALYKATYGDAPQSTVNAWLINNAVLNAITNNPPNTPNRRLYKAGL